MELDYSDKYSDWKATSPVDLIYAPQVKTVRVKSILTAIKQLMGAADEIIIATDFDREGELIGMETVKYAEADMSKVKRARFSALTKGEVEAAFSSAHSPRARSRTPSPTSWNPTRSSPTPLRQGRSSTSRGEPSSPD